MATLQTLIEEKRNLYNNYMVIIRAAFTDWFLKDQALKDQIARHPETVARIKQVKSGRYKYVSNAR